MASLHRHRSLVSLGDTRPSWRMRLRLHVAFGILCRGACHSFSPSAVFELVNVSRPSMYSLLDSTIIYESPVWCWIQVLRFGSHMVMSNTLRSSLSCATGSITMAMRAFFSVHASGSLCQDEASGSVPRRHKMFRAFDNTCRAYIGYIALALGA